MKTWKVCFLFRKRDKPSFCRLEIIVKHKMDLKFLKIPFKVVNLAPCQQTWLILFINNHNSLRELCLHNLSRTGFQRLQLSRHKCLKRDHLSKRKANAKHRASTQRWSTQMLIRQNWTLSTINLLKLWDRQKWMQSMISLNKWNNLESSSGGSFTWTNKFSNLSWFTNIRQSQSHSKICSKTSSRAKKITIFH